MKFIYQSEGTEAPEWVVEIDMASPRLTAGEAVWLERHNGSSSKNGFVLRTLSSILEACAEGEMTAMFSLLFVYRKRQEPTLRYQDFEDSIVTDDLTVELSDEETAALGLAEDDPKEPAESGGDSETSEPSPSTD